VEEVAGVQILVEVRVDADARPQERPQLAGDGGEYCSSTWPRTGSAYAHESRNRAVLAPPSARMAEADFSASATEAKGRPSFSASFVSPETL
jgi:hypothetical protein